MKPESNPYACLPFWSWNDELDEETLRKQIRWMKDNGVGGFFMHARGGLKTPYLGEKWFSCVEACEDEAEKLGMNAYVYDENGWPSGFAGGKLLEDPENHDQYLTMEKGDYDEKALACFEDDGKKLTRVYEGHDLVKIYAHLSPSTADICNPEVVRKFLALTHEQYKSHDEGNLKGFFTDEPQYFRWGTSYTRILPLYFLQHYHYDLHDKIALLFLEREGYRQFRYDYWLAMQDLMLHSYGKQVYDWCEKNHYVLTGHYVEETSLYMQLECCGGVMPFYQNEHIPGIDWLGRDLGNDLSPRQVASAAAQTGKKQVIGEVFGCAGWDVTPRELKHIYEWLAVNGLNLMCQHLMPYSEHGQRKRDYPAHYSPINPWVKKGFKDFNDYFSSLGKTLAESKEQVDVAVLHNIRSAYFTYKRDDSVPGHGTWDLDKSLMDLMDEFSKRHVSYHFLDESLLESMGSVEDGKIRCGLCSYKVLVLPLLYTMSKNTEKLIKEFLTEGGRLLVYGEKPHYLEGKPHEYPFLQSNITWEGIEQEEPYRAEGDSDIRLSYRKDAEGNGFFYAVNLGEEGDILLKMDGVHSFLKKDPETGESESVGEKIHFPKWASFTLIPQKEEARASEIEKKRFTFGKVFSLKEPVMNLMTLDKASYSLDGEHYSEPMLVNEIQNALLEKRYRGPLSLRFAFESRFVPSHFEILCELDHLKGISLNGVPMVQTGTHPLEAKLGIFSGPSQVGHNEILLRLDYDQGEHVYDVLFGEKTESLLNCLAYDANVEAIYLRGDFGVYGEFEPGKKSDVLLGKNFYLDQQRSEVSSLIEDGFPFYAGELPLEQDVALQEEEKILTLEGRFHLLDLRVNGQDAGRMMFEQEKDLSKLLHPGTNHFEIDLTVGNRNLLGPLHDSEQEPMMVSPYGFEHQGGEREGDYSFVKTIL